MWREIALCLQPLPRYIWGSRDVLVTSSAGPVRPLKERRIHRLRQALLDPIRVDENPDAGIEIPDIPIDDPPPPPPHVGSPSELIKDENDMTKNGLLDVEEKMMTTRRPIQQPNDLKVEQPNDLKIEQPNDMRDGEGKENEKIEEDSSAVQTAIQTPADVEEPAVLYKHRIFYNVESSYSEILQSGGLFGHWKPLYRPEDEVEETLQELLGVDSQTVNESRFSLPLVSQEGFTENFKLRTAELSGSASRVLQPLCILLPAPLPETCRMMACHDTLAELVNVEVEPMGADDSFGKEVIDPVIIDLLLQFKFQYSKLLVIRHFNNEATHKKLRYGCPELQKIAGAVLHRLATPFVIMCPLCEDGKSLDIEFVVNSLRLNIMTLRGIS